jgi:hypothetical protein
MGGRRGWYWEYFHEIGTKYGGNHTHLNVWCKYEHALKVEEFRAADKKAFEAGALSALRPTAKLQEAGACEASSFMYPVLTLCYIIF